MDCTPQQFNIADQILEVRSETIQTLKPPDVRCVDGIVGIHDEVLGKVLILITPDGVALLTPKGITPVGPEFLEQYRKILSITSI